jgi:hypothetical protein
MIYPNGTKIKVNGKIGMIIKHFPASKENGEQESYLVWIDTKNGVEELELKADEFTVI